MTVMSEATARELMVLHQWSAGYLERLPTQHVDLSIAPTEAIHVAEQRNDPVVSLAGNVGKAPIKKETSKGSVVNFSLAVTGGYGEDAPTYWYECAVWNEGLQESVMREVIKGGKVAVEGFFTQREYEGKTYNQINAARVGVIEWLQRTKRAASVAAAPAAAPGTPAFLEPRQSTENDW